MRRISKLQNCKRVGRGMRACKSVRRRGIKRLYHKELTSRPVGLSFP